MDALPVWRNIRHLCSSDRSPRALPLQIACAAKFFHATRIGKWRILGWIRSNCVEPLSRFVCRSEPTMAFKWLADERTDHQTPAIVAARIDANLSFVSDLEAPKLARIRPAR